MLKMMLVAGCGGFVGTCLRFLVGKACAEMKVGGFPMGTFVVNIVGSLLIGVLLGLAEQRGVLTPTLSALLVTGFCGGFTTFSTFADDMFLMAGKGAWVMLFAYIFLSLALGVAMVALGRWAVR